MRCVEIMIHDDGSFMVRECEPPEMEEMEGGQTFKSAEEAAQAAIQILQSAPAGGENELQAAMHGGYNKVAGPGRMQGAGPGRMQGAGMQFAEE